MSPSLLLRADQHRLILVGKRTEELLDSLVEWVTVMDTRAIPALAVVTGAGGSGKTRIGVSLATRLQLGGFRLSGFVGKRGLNFREELNVHALVTAGRSVLIVDYAETDPANAIAVLEMAAEASLEGGQHRVVFLVRSLTSTVSNWLSGLVAIGVSAQVETALGLATHVHGDDLLTQDELAGLYQHSVETFRNVLSPRQDGLSTSGAACSDREFGSALDACAEGLAEVLAAMDGGDAPVNPARSAIEKVVDHECRYLRALAERSEYKTVQRLRPERLVVAMTLSNGDSPEALIEGLSTVTGFSALDALDRERSIEFLKTMYPGDLLPSGLQPDRVLESMADTIFENDAAFVGRLLDADISLSPCLITLARIGQHGRCWSPEMFALIEGKLPRILEKCLLPNQEVLSSALAEFVSRIGPEISAPVLSGLSLGIPIELHLPAAELALVLSQAHLNSADTEEDRGKAFLVLAIRFRELGRHGEAFGPSQQAVDIRGRLVRVEGHRHLPGYAMSLNNHAALLRELGRHGEAFELSQHVADIYAELVRVQGDGYLREHAMALYNHGNLLRELGRHGEAFELSQQAVNIYAQLGQAHDEQYLPDHAMALNSHAVLLFGLGRHGEEFESSQQAVDIYGRLVDVQGDRHLPHHAASLSNHALLLRELGRYQEAFGPSQHAVNIYGQLVEVHGDQYLPERAKSLLNHANLFRELGRHGEAFEPSQQGVDDFEGLVEADGDHYLPDYDMSVNNHAFLLNELGRHDDARRFRKAADLSGRSFSASRREVEILRGIDAILQDRLPARSQAGTGQPDLTES
jgi:tetratricopeptide (TPR) repeat protein